MNADLDDDPRFGRSEPRSPWLMFAISLGSAVMIWAGIETFVKPTVANINRVSANSQHLNQPAPNMTQGNISLPITESFRAEKDTYSASRPKTISRVPESIALDPNRSKQTVFNDRNYSGSGAINTVSFSRPVAIEDQEAEEQGKTRVTVISQAARAEDNCQYRKGSIEQRNCRMAADLYDRNRQ